MTGAIQRLAMATSGGARRCPVEELGRHRVRRPLLVARSVAQSVALAHPRLVDVSEEMTSLLWQMRAVGQVKV